MVNVAERDHAGEIVVDGTSEDATQHDPKEGSCAELSAHDGTDDGTYTSNVQELNQEDTPRLHRHVVDTIGHSDGRGGALRVDAEDLLDKLSVYKIAENEDGQSDKESNHNTRFYMAAKIRFLKYIL